MGDLVGGVRDWLEKSGRALELRVARELQQTGHADVQQSFTYQDVVTATTREGDVRASFPWTGPGGVPCSITLAVECKSGAEHPWVAFHTGAPADGAGALEDWVVFAHGPFVGITEPLAGLWVGHPPFTTGPVASHVVAAHEKEGRNPANDAVRQVLSCAAGIRQEYLVRQGRRPVGLVCMAAVVTTAPLMTCRLDQDGRVELEVVKGFDVWGYGHDGARHRVFVRSEQSLPAFAEGLRHRAAAAGT